MALNVGMEVFDLIKNSDFMQSSVNSLRTAVGGTKVHALVRTIAKIIVNPYTEEQIDTNTYLRTFFCGHIRNRFNMAS